MSMLGGVRDRAEFNRRLAITAALLVVYRLGTYIPLPGINSEALAQLGGTAVERISIFALGITPFVTVLILAELAKVLFPRCRQWELADPRNRARLNRILVVLSILVAAVQGLGLAGALENVTTLVDEPGVSFRLACIATLVAGVALVVWLADQITRHGLGCGVWLVFVTPWLAEIPARIAGLAASWPDWGPAVSVQLLIGCAVAVLVLAAIVRLLKAGRAPQEMAATSLWSVLLADAAWPWLMLVVALIASGGGLQDVGSWLNPAHPFVLLVLAGLVALFTHLYLRSQLMAGVTSFSAIPPALVAVALAAIALADMVLATQLGALVPLAGHHILIAVVALSLLARWWQPPFAAAEPEARDERS